MKYRVDLDFIAPGYDPPPCTLLSVGFTLPAAAGVAVGPLRRNPPWSSPVACRAPREADLFLSLVVGRQICLAMIEVETDPEWPETCG